MALVLALGAYLPGWLATIIVAVVLLVAGAVTGLMAWRRLPEPLAITRRTLRENLRWVGGRFA